MIEEAVKINRKRIERIMKKVAQELPGDYTAQLIAAQKILNKDKNLSVEETYSLISFLGQDATKKLLVMEDLPAISRSRATTVVNWFDMLVNAIKSKADSGRILYLARKTVLEFVNALADTTVRS